MTGNRQKAVFAGLFAGKIPLDKRRESRIIVDTEKSDDKASPAKPAFSEREMVEALSQGR